VWVHWTSEKHHFPQLLYFCNGAEQCHWMPATDLGWGKEWHHLRRGLLALDDKGSWLRGGLQSPKADGPKLNEIRTLYKKQHIWEMPGMPVDSQHDWVISNLFVPATREGCKHPLGWEAMDRRAAYPGIGAHTLAVLLGMICNRYETSFKG